MQDQYAVADQGAEAGAIDGHLPDTNTHIKQTKLHISIFLVVGLSAAVSILA